VAKPPVPDHGKPPQVTCKGGFELKVITVDGSLPRAGETAGVIRIAENQKPLRVQRKQVSSGTVATP
jgi:hypothetical protein